MSDQQVPQTFTHLDEQGHASMVDVTEKAVTQREAVAEAYVQMQPETLELILSGGHKKGDVLAVARIAGIQAAKRTSDLIPLCHPLMLTKVGVELTAEPEHNRIRIEAVCKLAGQTGVEMEALTAASVAALTLYDMCKAVDKTMVISGTKVLEKKGGKSGHWVLESDSNVAAPEVEEPVSLAASVFPDEIFEPESKKDSPMVQVKFFAQLREQLGMDECLVPMHQLEKYSVAGVKQWLLAQHPNWDTFLMQKSLLMAVNQNMVKSDAGIEEGDEVAFFPPVTGG